MSCSIWFCAPSFWMGGGPENRCVGRVYGADGSMAHSHKFTHNSKWQTVYSVEEMASFALISSPLHLFRSAVPVQSRLNTGRVHTNICPLFINVTHRPNKNNRQSYLEMFSVIRIRPLMKYLRLALPRPKLCIQPHCVATNSHTSYHIELCVANCR